MAEGPPPPAGMSPWSKLALAVVGLAVLATIIPMFLGGIADGASILYRARMSIEWLGGKVFIFALGIAVLIWIFKKPNP